MRVKKVLHDKTIELFQAMTDWDGDALFAPNSVKKLYITQPTDSPSCQIVPNAPMVRVDGIDFDERSIGFTAIIGDLIESNENDYDVIDEKLDRLSDIEDVIMESLEEIPNVAEGWVEGQKVLRIDIAPAGITYEVAPDGLRIYLTVNFYFVISVAVKFLGE